MTALTLNADHRTYLTPLEQRGGRWYKRDDLLRFSNGVNGKVRSALYLAELAKAQGAVELVYGGSVLAPALGRVASAAAYAGLECRIVVGSDPAKAVRHDTVRVAVEAGARLVRSSVPYNPALQKRAREIADGSGGRTFQVPYGVSTREGWRPRQVRAFLEVDTAQVAQLIASPVETLIIPFGSGNAAAAILYGLANVGAGNLRRIVLMGVGPDRMGWLRQRLEYVQVAVPPIEMLHIPLHPHFAQYSDRMAETCDGITMHPTYEGKVVRYLNTTAPPWWARRDDTTCLWIVGGPLPTPARRRRMR
jgi:Pyridoxal-phosphate dependent enzyme